MFHIIDDWYLVADDNCWMVARNTGVKKGKHGSVSPRWENHIYMGTPEDALRVFADNYVHAKVRSEGAEGELKDALIFLSNEYKRLSDSISEAFTWAKKQAL